MFVLYVPQGPSKQISWDQITKAAIRGIAFRTQDLHIWVVKPSKILHGRFALKLVELEALQVSLGFAGTPCSTLPECPPPKLFQTLAVPSLGRMSGPCRILRWTMLYFKVTRNSH